MASPEVFRKIPRVIVWEIVDGNVDVESARDVAVVFLCQRIAVILGVPRYEDLPEIVRCRNIKPCVLRDGKDVKRLDFLHVLNAHLGMSGMGGKELLVKAAQKGMTKVACAVAEDSEHLFGSRLLLNSIGIV